jgi:hypothetical protein
LSIIAVLLLVSDVLFSDPWQVPGGPCRLLELSRTADSCTDRTHVDLSSRVCSVASSGAARACVIQQLLSSEAESENMSSTGMATFHRLVETRIVM